MSAEIPENPAPADPNPAVSKPSSTMPQIIVQQQQSAFGRYGKLLLVLLGVAVLSIIGLSASYQSYFSPPGGPQEKYHSLDKRAKEKIAIISVEGTIVAGDGFIKQQIDMASKDEQVVAIVLRINSPGGTVTGSDFLYHHVKELAKERNLPLVVSMGSICASGGYYIAMAVGDQENVVFAEPSTWTGSIGVVIPHYDFSGMLTRYDVKDDSIASHKYKLMGSPTRVLSDEERAEQRQLLQVLVDQSFERFQEIVRNGRPKLEEDQAAFDAIATGQIFTASQALEHGLIDQIGFIEDAIERAAELAQRNLDDLRCVKYDQPPATIGSLLSAKSSRRESLALDLRSLFELATPRAYYLCAGYPHHLLPSLVGSDR